MIISKKYHKVSGVSQISPERRRTFMVKKETKAIKRVRTLLRVSSHQQLEADGDLKLQRQIVSDYVDQHEDWESDGKEYFGLVPIKILPRTELLCKKLIKTQRTKNTTY